MLRVPLSLVYLRELVSLWSHLPEGTEALGPLTFSWLDKAVILLPLSWGLAFSPVADAADVGSGW